MNWTEIHKEALNYFQQYLRIDTSNPPGNEIEGATFFKNIFDKENIGNRIYETAPKRGNIIAKIEGDKKEKPLYLFNHIDIVPVDREKWELDPFGGEIKDGYVCGRGTQDMKNMAIIQMMVMILMKHEKINMNRDLYFIATADEERESNYGIIKLIEEIPELSKPGYVINEGGGGTRGIFSNDDKIVWGIGVGEKKPLFLHLEVSGKAGHGSLPDGNNPNEILITALNRIMNYIQEEKTHPVVNEIIKKLGNIPDNKFASAIKKDTITITTLKAGVGDPPKENVIPSISTASIDCRLLPGKDPYEFIENLKIFINDDRVIIKPTKIPKEVPTSSTNTELFHIISEVINKNFPESIVVPIIVPYATDSRYLRDRGFSCYGFTPTVATLEDLSLMHSDNEKIAIKEFFKGMELFYNIILEFCRKN